MILLKFIIAHLNGVTINVVQRMGSMLVKNQYKSVVSWLLPQLGSSLPIPRISMVPVHVNMGRQATGLKGAHNTLKKEVVIHLVGNRRETL